MTDPARPASAADPALRPTVAHDRAADASDDGADTPGDDPTFAPPQAAGELGRLGRFRVLKRLGRGGMGTVYLGHDEALDRAAALKVMSPAQAAAPGARARFLREARAAAKVKSDHVVTIFDVGEEGGNPFIAMEYLQGASLEKFLNTRGELPLAHALRVARETALGLAAAHALGMIHRDIKPDNLWLEAPDGRVKILDFGLARVQTDDVRLTGSGLVVGTPVFMSPEQGRGDEVDHRTDLWSLGVVLYRLCTGQLPFDGPSTMAVLTALAVSTPTPPRRLNPQLPVAVEAVINRLLAKNAADRYQTARAVADALQAVADAPVAAGAPLAVAPQAADARSVWENLDGSGTEVVRSAPSDETEVGPAARTRGAKLPLILGGVAVGLAVVAVAAVMLWPKTPEVAQPDGPPPPPGLPKLPPKPPVPFPKPPLPQADADRRAAEMVLSKGGAVTVVIDGEQRAISRPDELPTGAFALTIAHMSDNLVTAEDIELLRACRGLWSFTLQNTNAGEHELKSFAGTTGLTNVTLEQAPRLTDVSLQYFAGCRELRNLSVADTPVTDAGLAHFAMCTNIHILNVSRTRVTDAGLAGLANNRALKRLLVSGTAITDVTLERFAANPLVEEVEFLGTKVTDAGFAHLARWRKLRTVDATATAVTDAGLEHLKGLKSLQRLALTSTKATDAGLAHLGGLESLEHLDVFGTKVTEAGVMGLAAKLPGCRIVWDKGTIQPKK